MKNATQDKKIFMPNQNFWKSMMDQRPPPIFSRYFSFKRNYFSFNQVGHKASGYINQMRNYSFNGNCHYCNKVGHKASECRRRMI